jgi:uncharacterized phage infection (PIP) family protein YhgE
MSDDLISGEKPSRDDIQRYMKAVDDLSSLNDTAQRNVADVRSKVEQADARLRIAQKAATEAAEAVRDIKLAEGRIDGEATRAMNALVAARAQLAKAIDLAYGIAKADSVATAG